MPSMPQPMHLATDVVGVEVGGQRADAPHPVGGQDAQQVVDPIGGVDDHRLAGLAVPHQVDEVDHLTGDLVAGGEVAAGQQLAEVEPVGTGRDRVRRRSLTPHCRVRTAG